MNNSNDKAAPLPLPAPEVTPNLEGSGAGTTKLDIGTGVSTVKFDELGPLVVNSDGTLSRIANWQNMTEIERQRTLRVLSARNKARLENEEKKLREEGTHEGNTSTRDSVSALSPISSE